MNLKEVSTAKLIQLLEWASDNNDQEVTNVIAEELVSRLIYEEDSNKKDEMLRGFGYREEKGKVKTKRKGR